MDSSLVAQPDYALSFPSCHNTYRYPIITVNCNEVSSRLSTLVAQPDYAPSFPSPHHNTYRWHIIKDNYPQG
jgi:hypothetical protein